MRPRFARPSAHWHRLRLAVLSLLLTLQLGLGPAAYAAPAMQAGPPPPTPPGATIFLPMAAQAGSGPGQGQADGHSHNDYALAAQAQQRNEPPFRIDPRRRAAAPGPTDLINTGQWGPVVTWPFVFASAASLPDGRIIAWGGNNTTSFSGGTSTYAAIWDPASGQFLSRNHPDHSMFCAIPTMLEDGRVFVNGGDGTRERTSIFDYRTNSWQRVQNMSTGRWYNGAVALPNGKVFTMLGDPGGSYPELWTEGQGWSLLTGANLNSGVLNFTGYQSTWLPYLHLAPNGRIFHAGPTQQMNWLDPTGNGSITSAGLTNTWYPKYSTGIMYEEGKLLFAGGAANSTSTAPGSNQAMIIDLSEPIPQKTVIAPMAFARKFNNGVVLPTGEVLIVGGNSSGTEFSDVGTQLTPEIWNPTTQTWRSVADMSVPRNYHSVALLMPDGRVWSGGGGLCACAADHPDAQIYSPPYLFNADGSPAARPLISSAPAIATYGASIGVQADPGIQSFRLIKMSGLTHNLNSDLRALTVPFTTPSSGQYQLTLSSNPNVLTPGYWMLFAVNSQGVPSVAKVMQVISSNAPRVTNPGAQSSTVGAAVSLPIQASDPNGDALTYSAGGLPSGLSIDPSTGVIAGTPNAAGSYRATVNVSDGSSTTSVVFDWSVAAVGSIRYVKLEALSEVNGQAWSSAAELNILDAGGNALSRAGWTITTDSQETQGEDGRAVNAIDGNVSTIWHTQWYTTSPQPPHWLVIDMQAGRSVGGFRYLPRQGAINGTIADYRFYVSADGVNWGQPVAQGRFANDNTEKTVLLSANRLPTLAPVAGQSSSVGTATSLALSASDPDGDVLTYSAAGLPAGLSINSGSGLISGTPTAAGSASVTVSVSDGRGGSASQSFSWQISPPALSLNPISSAPQPTNSAISYTASASNAVNPRFKWLFGDGTPETAYSSAAGVSHSFGQPGIYVVKLTATDDRGVEQSTTFVQAIHLPHIAGRAVASSSIAYEARGGANHRVWVINPDNDSVSVLDATNNTRLAEITVGTAPRSVAIAPNGRVWVVNKRSAGISVIDPATLAVVQTVGLPYGSQPFGLAFAPGGGAYVTLEAAGKLLRLDPTTGAQTGSLDVGMHVRHLAISADGSTLYLSRFITPRVPGEDTAAPQTVVGGVQYGGELLVVNAGTLALTHTIVLRNSDKTDTEHSARGLPNYLGAAALAPDGVSGWVPSKQDNILRGVLRDGNNLNFQNSVRAITSRINLAGGNEDYPARIDLDNAGVASAALFDRYGNYLFVALETNRQVAVLDAYGRRELFRIEVGRAPQGLALSADGMRLFVQNFMSRSVSVHDLTGLITRGEPAAPTLATIGSVASERLAAQVLLGKQHFYDARDQRLALDSYISCAACHNDGGGDGRVWDLTGFGEGLRNTIDLNGRAGMGHGPLHWSANFDEVHDFEGQIRSLAGGSGLMSDANFNAGTRAQPLGDAKAGLSADLDALAAYVGSLTSFFASPFRNSDGTLTADGAAGKLVFQSAGCAQCHGGVAFTNSGAANLSNIGTLKPSSGGRLGGTLTGIDIPTLRGIWAGAPYLHDGSATTLAQAVQAHNNVALSSADLTKLVAYLQQIGSEEPVAPGSLGSGQILREWWAGIGGVAVADLTNSPAYPYQPSGSGMLSSFETPTDWADNYGTRVRGYVHAPVTGQYTFWIASDDASQLLLSTDDSPAKARQIASVGGWTNSREWSKYTTQQSVAITLQAGQKYYIEALQKEGGGGDNLAVAWQIPGGAREVIAGQYLSPYQPPAVTNVAQARTASQSSTSSGAGAIRAVDGNTNGNFSAGSVTLTRSNTNAWWQVDLGASYQLDSVQLWNRTDCCANRLSNFYVFVSNTSMAGRSYSSLVGDSTVWKVYIAGQAPAKLNIPAYLSGRYVRVQLAGTNNLSLAEVQVWGRQ